MLWISCNNISSFSYVKISQTVSPDCFWKVDEFFIAMFHVSIFYTDALARTDNKLAWQTIHTSFLKELCSNNEYVITYLITICLFQSVSNFIKYRYIFFFSIESHLSSKYTKFMGNWEVGLTFYDSFHGGSVDWD